MNTVALSGIVRTTIGSKDATLLRRDKRVPCVLYGGDKIVHFSVDEAVIGKLIFTPEVNGVELDLDGQKTLAMIQDKQFHPTTDRVLHVDFKQLDPNQPTTTQLSLRLQGQPIGVRKGGSLSQTLRKLRVKGLPVSIPQHLELDVVDLDINSTVRVKDLKFEGLTLLERPEDVVVSVKMSKKVVEVAKEGDDKKGAKKK